MMGRGPGPSLKILPSAYLGASVVAGRTFLRFSSLPPSTFPLCVQSILLRGAAPFPLCNKDSWPNQKSRPLPLGGGRCFPRLRLRRPTLLVLGATPRFLRPS